MGRIFEHISRELRIGEKYGSLRDREVGLEEQSSVADMREKMREKYGWLSPSQYYSGQYDSQSEPNELFISLRDIEEYRKGTGELPTKAADRTEIPHYFWVDSLSNWCYFKITDDMTPFKKTESRFGKWGNSLLNIWTRGLIGSIDAVQSEGDWTDFFLNWAQNIVLSFVDMTTTPIEGLIDIEEYIVENIGDFENELLGTDITANWSSVINSKQLTIGAMMLRATSELLNTGKTSIPGILWAWIQSAYNLSSYDVDAEPYVERLATGNDEHNLPRNCISLYMWNGYKRNWVPIKQLIDIYDKYCKRSSYDLVYATVKNFYPLLISLENDILDTFLEAIGLPLNSNDPRLEDFRRKALEIREMYSGSEDLFNSNFTELIMSMPQGVNYCARFLFINIYGIDPACIETIQSRSPLSKKQTLYNWDTHSSDWAQKKWQENVSYWIALPNDTAKIKLYANDTYQLINRPTAYKDWFTRDLKGYLHKNIGHPCFMRGNDDVLWMCYWQRWSSTRGKEIQDGTILTKTIIYEGKQDIMKPDVESWDSILSIMFDKNDDYGFEDWLINSNYLLNYSKFTVDEEQPSEILTFEESSIAPNRAEPVNSVDEYDGETLTLNFSSGTVVSRDDGNEFIDTAKRWR